MDEYIGSVKLENGRPAAINTVSALRYWKHSLGKGLRFCRSRIQGKRKDRETVSEMGKGRDTRIGGDRGFVVRILMREQTECERPENETRCARVSVCVC